MSTPERFFAVVPAAGTGSRMGASLPKQYLRIADRSLLAWSLAPLLRCRWIDRVIVVCAPGDQRAEAECAALAALPAVGDRLRLAPVGGATRRDSVLAGLAALQDPLRGDPPAAQDWVLVHDAARPGLTIEALSRLRDALTDDPVGGLLALPVADTVKRGVGGRIDATVPRDTLWLAQTPQMFRVACLGDALRAHPDVTDEAAAIEAQGLSPRLVEGERRNFKITTAGDLAAMAAILSPIQERDAMPTIRIGQGYDVHALVPGRALVVGGVQIPYPRGLLGHSDADVLLHAITDALLGAAALGDIGRHFPDSDPRFRGADSALLLREAARRVRAAGCEIVNVDATVIAQAPKLAPYIPAMVAAIADALGIGTSQVNVKGKTTERLGFAGRGEGIAAQAVAMLRAVPDTLLLSNVDHRDHTEERR